jgi:hypothetical protein
MHNFEVPFVQGEIKYLHLDAATFLKRILISEPGGWPPPGRAPDGDVAIFAMANLPLQEADEGQTIKLVIKVMHYLLLGLVLDTGRAKGDAPFPLISETVWLDLVASDGSSDDVIDAGRKLGSSGGHRGSELKRPLKTGPLLLSTAY